MGNMAKQKGKRGEREFAEVLTRLLAKDPSWEDERIFVDPQANGSDIASIPGLSIEVKRHETLNCKGWWRQALVQADQTGGIPIVAFRQNRKAWKVLMPAYLLVLGLDGYVELELPIFGKWLLHFTRE